MLKSYKKIIAQELQETLLELDEQRLKAVCTLILKTEAAGGRVHLTGIGKPSYIAGYAASLFSSIGIPAYFLDGTEAVHGSSGQVQAEDLVIAISNSGETTELLAAVSTLKKNGAQIVVLSRSHHSSLAMLAEISLTAAVDLEGDNLNKPPRASIVAELIYLQALSILLQEAKGLTLDTYLAWHPGGTIGQALETSS